MSFNKSSAIYAKLLDNLRLPANVSMCDTGAARSWWVMARYEPSPISEDRVGVFLGVAQKALRTCPCWLVGLGSCFECFFRRSTTSLLLSAEPFVAEAGRSRRLRLPTFPIRMSVLSKRRRLTAPGG